jgi:multidrug resistance efflux pump
LTTSPSDDLICYRRRANEENFGQDQATVATISIEIAVVRWQLDQLLPYVAPTTDWIRLEQRFPVTLVLQEQSPGTVLHMSADARTLVVY